MLSLVQNIHFLFYSYLLAAPSALLFFFGAAFFRRPEKGTTPTRQDNLLHLNLESIRFVLHRILPIPLSFFFVPCLVEFASWIVFIEFCICSSALAKGGQETIYDEKAWVVFYF